MVQLTDSTRRLIIFVTIVLGGSILLIFDIPVLYLMMVVIGLAIGLMVATGMLILSEVIKDLRIRLKNRKPKPKKSKPKSEKTSAAKGAGGGFFSGLMQKLPKMPSLPSVNLSLPKSSGKPDKKEKPAKKQKTQEPDEAGDISGSGSSVSGESRKNEDNIGDDLLDGLDLDDSLDIDAELESVNPEFDSVRTPYGDTDVMQELPSEEQVRRMDITTSAEEEDVVLDTEEPSDEIDEIYSSTIEIGSDSGGEIISTMEGGDSISGSDLASYSSSEDTPYMYGGEDDSGGGEEQFELSQGKGGLGDDDLIASLKADISDLKKRDDDVLLRDLKDVHVTAEELAEELEDIMKIITKKAKNK
nr:MFS transporter [uncultured Methanospirillum sp.]